MASIAKVRNTLLFAQRAMLNTVHFSSNLPNHTGQEFSAGDPRNARYIGGKKKEINPNHGIKLVAEEPIEIAGANHVYCAGGDGHLGHPKVYINLDKGIVKPCGYCGKQYTAH